MGGWCLARTKTQPSTKCELSEANLRLGTRADVDYGERGNANVGRQITVDVTLSDGRVVTCRLDNLVKQGNAYKIIDAKSSIINNLSTKNVDELISQYATSNQKTFYDALKNGRVKSIKPRGQNAIDYFRGINSNMPLPNNLPIGNQIEFLVNDVATDGYNVYKKIFRF